MSNGVFISPHANIFALHRELNSSEESESSRNEDETVLKHSSHYYDCHENNCTDLVLEKTNQQSVVWLETLPCFTNMDIYIRPLILVTQIYEWSININRISIEFYMSFYRRLQLQLKKHKQLPYMHRHCAICHSMKHDVIIWRRKKLFRNAIYTCVFMWISKVLFTKTRLFVLFKPQTYWNNLGTSRFATFQRSNGEELQTLSLSLLY